MLADMVEAQEAPAPRSVEIGRLERSLELPGRGAAGNRAMRLRPLDPTVQFALFGRHTSSLAQPYYIGAMNASATGPVATEMLRRLGSALSPTKIDLNDDSEAHFGHGGYNPSGESHFSLRIESPAFAGRSRVERQRMIYSALGELMDSRVHALSIRATAPGE
jgi:BolA protein